MALVTLQVVDGADKGRVFRALPTPLTIGREEGNTIRLNDERVSRYHLKIQDDNGKVVVTDLDSTNGTRVNGQFVQLRVLRYGDQIHLGRSLLLYGSPEEIAARLASLTELGRDRGARTEGEGAPDSDEPTPTVELAGTRSPAEFDSAKLSFSLHDDVTGGMQTVASLVHGPPELPEGLRPAQAAQLAELLDFIHERIARVLDHVQAEEGSIEAVVPFEEWQALLSVEAHLASFLRRLGDPED